MTCGSRRAGNSLAAENQALIPRRSSAVGQRIYRGPELVAHDTDRQGGVRLRQNRGLNKYVRFALSKDYTSTLKNKKGTLANKRAYEKSV